MTKQTTWREVNGDWYLVNVEGEVIGCAKQMPMAYEGMWLVGSRTFIDLTAAKKAIEGAL